MGQVSCSPGGTGSGRGSLVRPVPVAPVRWLRGDVCGGRLSHVTVGSERGTRWTREPLAQRLSYFFMSLS